MGACQNCYLHADLSLRFQLKITHYKLELLEISATGTAKGNLGSSFTAKYDKEWTFEKQIADIKMTPIVLYIGVPVTLDFEAPIQLGLDASVRANANVHAHASFAGSLT